MQLEWGQEVCRLITIKDEFAFWRGSQWDSNDAPRNAIWLYSSHRIEEDQGPIIGRFSTDNIKMRKLYRPSITHTHTHIDTCVCVTMSVYRFQYRFPSAGIIRLCRSGLLVFVLLFVSFGRRHCCRCIVRKQHFRRSRWRQEENLTYHRHNNIAGN